MSLCIYRTGKAFSAYVPNDYIRPFKYLFQPKYLFLFYLILTIPRLISTQALSNCGSIDDVGFSTLYWRVHNG